MGFRLLKRNGARRNRERVEHPLSLAQTKDEHRQKSEGNGDKGIARAPRPLSGGMDLIAHGIFGAAGELGAELVVDPGNSDGVEKVAQAKRDHLAGS